MIENTHISMILPFTSNQLGPLSTPVWFCWSALGQSRQSALVRFWWCPTTAALQTLQSLQSTPVRSLQSAQVICLSPDWGRYGQVRFSEFLKQSDTVLKRKLTLIEKKNSKSDQQDPTATLECTVLMVVILLIWIILNLG